jgi:ferritin
MKKIGLLGISHVKEQIEEENPNYLMDKITLAGGENAKGDALYQLDKDLEKLQVKYVWLRT